MLLMGIIGGEICNFYVQKNIRKTRDYRKNTRMLSSMLPINGPVVNSFALKWKYVYVKSHDFSQYFVIFEKF